MTVIVSRSAWGAKPAVPGGNKFSPPILGLGVHWEAAPPKADHALCDDQVRQIQAFHMGPARGWNDIAYNALACNHGRLYQGRIGGTAANGTDFGNEHFPAVCWLGGPGHTPTDAALSAIHDAKSFLGVPASAPVYPHNHFLATACPGPALTAWCKAGAKDPHPGEPKPPPALVHYEVVGAEGRTFGPFNFIDGLERLEDRARAMHEAHKDDPDTAPDVEVKLIRHAKGSQG